MDYLASVAGIMIGALMLRSDVFSTVAAYALILGDAIGLGLYIPAIGIFYSVIGTSLLSKRRRLSYISAGVLGLGVIFTHRPWPPSRTSPCA